MGPQPWAFSDPYGILHCIFKHGLRTRVKNLVGLKVDCRQKKKKLPQNRTLDFQKLWILIRNSVEPKKGGEER